MKKNKFTKDRFLTWLYFFILIFLVLFLFFNKYGLLKYFELQNEIHTIERKIEESKSEIKVLDKNIESLKNNDSELEKVAREKFHMKKKNEKAFQFYDKKDSAK